MKFNLYIFLFSAYLMSTPFLYGERKIQRSSYDATYHSWTGTDRENLLWTCKHFGKNYWGRTIRINDDQAARYRWLTNIDEFIQEAKTSDTISQQTRNEAAIILSTFKKPGFQMNIPKIYKTQLHGIAYDGTEK